MKQKVERQKGALARLEEKGFDKDQSITLATCLFQKKMN